MNTKIPWLALLFLLLAAPVFGQGYISTNGVMVGAGPGLRTDCEANQVLAWSTVEDEWVCDDQAGAAGGDSISIDSSAVVDPDFVSTGDVDFVDTSNTITANINADAVKDTHIDWGTGEGQVSAADLGLAIDASGFNGLLTTSHDTLQEIAQALDDIPLPTAASFSVDDLITLSGVAEGATSLGAFTGSTITDNQTIKASLQLLETAVEGVAGEVIDASGFDGNLATTDDTLQEVAQKVDDLALGSGSVDDTAYGVGWDSVTDTAPSKNAVYDKIEGLAGGHDAVTIAAATAGLTLSTQEITLNEYIDDIAEFSDPAADRLWFFDDSASAFAGLTVGNGLAISTTTIALDTTWLDDQDITWTGTQTFTGTVNLPSAITLPDESVDSDQYVDGSIDAVHLSFTALSTVPSCLSSAPSTPTEGEESCADGNGWQPGGTDQGNDDWIVRYCSTCDGGSPAWIGVYNITDGAFILNDGGAVRRYHQTADFDPDSLYETYSGVIVLDPKTAADLTITELYAVLNEDPTTELTITAYFKTAAIGFTGGTAIGSGETDGGILTVTSGWTDATIPAGSKIWIVVGDDPDETTIHASVSLTGSYD